MSDDLWRRDEIESPCTNICQIHPGARICIGCLRTGEEIAAWSRLSAERRRESACDRRAAPSQVFGRLFCCLLCCLLHARCRAASPGVVERRAAQVTRRGAGRA